jgi:hypothetical protein
MEKIKVLETDTECNSYNRKIGASNKLMLKINKRMSRDKQMHYLMPKPFRYTTCSKKPNLSIINIELKMKLNVIELMLKSLKRREIVKLLNIKNGLDKNNMNSISL